MPPVESCKMIRLSDLPPGACGIIRVVDADNEDMARLKTLGVCPGRRVELTRGGDPIVLKIFGTRLGLAAILAAHVRVDICDPIHCELHPEEPYP